MRKIVSFLLIIALVLTLLSVGIPTANAVVYFTITFNANGGSGSMPSVTVASDEEYELPDCTFTPPNR